MKYILAKTFGWDLDYIGKLPIKITNILLESINMELERQEAEIRRIKMKSRLR